MNNGLTQAQILSLISVSTPDANGNITIQITGYPYKPVTPLSNMFGLGTISLNRRAIFRWEMANSL
jgi:hypothetical protein